MSNRGSLEFTSVRQSVSDAEWNARVNLAACFRLADHYGMSDMIYTHISARVPDQQTHFLLNPHGLLFNEMTASCFLKVDLDGNIAFKPDLEQGYGLHAAGFVIHSAIYKARPDVMAIMHTHTIAGMAVAAQLGGLLPLNQISMEFDGRVATHDYEGVAADDNMSERERFVADLGDKPCMVLRHHGLLTVGRTVAEAFYWMWYLEQSCRIQLAAQGSGAPLAIPSRGTVERTRAQFGTGPTKGWLPWQALRRKLDREQPDYRD